MNVAGNLSSKMWHSQIPKTMSCLTKKVPKFNLGCSNWSIQIGICSYWSIQIGVCSNWSIQIGMCSNWLLHSGMFKLVDSI